MNKMSFALVGAAALALAACGGRDDAIAENVEENYEAAAENLEVMADNAAPAEAATLENQAEALREEGENMAEAIDDADATNAAEAAAAVNAM